MEKHHTIKEKAESYVKTNRSKRVTNLKEIRTILNGAADIVAEAYNECDDEDKFNLTLLTISKIFDKILT